MNTRIFAPAIAIVLAGCATAGGTQSGSEPERVTVISSGLTELEVRTTDAGTGGYHSGAPVEHVWAVLPQVYEELGVQLAVHDSVSRRIGNTGFRPRRLGDARLSQYLRCGTSITATPNADRYQVQVSLITRLSDSGDGGTTIATFLSATARPRDVGGSTVNCASTGRLEERVAEMVDERVGG